MQILLHHTGHTKIHTTDHFPDWIWPDVLERTFFDRIICAISHTADSFYVKCIPTMIYHNKMPSCQLAGDMASLVYLCFLTMIYHTRVHFMTCCNHPISVLLHHTGHTRAHTDEKPFYTSIMNHVSKQPTHPSLMVATWCRLCCIVLDTQKHTQVRNHCIPVW